MVQVTVPTELLLKFDDAAHEIGYTTPAALITFALTESLDANLATKESAGRRSPERDSDSTSTVTIPESLYDSFCQVADSNDRSAVESAIRSSLIAYARDSGLMDLEDGERRGGRESEIERNLKDLGYLD